MESGNIMQEKGLTGLKEEISINDLLRTLGKSEKTIDVVVFAFAVDESKI